ncbi:phytanoyl-CoA dioxygenase, peroxisomal [Elysia marginata]|uniref:phytanoyl-CoA dioxygenase n=1 Tax=Elysia marginata TaxID=1093978 RepID=A0AAV4IIZ1_9GAST|nr:phytanoyl-CoA dioxygenase, peroxisomal [Elysia marginata]
MFHIRHPNGILQFDCKPSWRSTVQARVVIIMASRLQSIFSHLQPVCDQTLAQPNTTSSSSMVVPSNEFRFTVNGCRLTNEQRAFYEKNGFLVIKRLVAPEKLDVFRQRFVQICKREVKVPNITIMRDVAIKDSEFVPGEQAITKIQEWQRDDVMFGYCCLPEVCKICLKIEKLLLSP